MTAAPPPLIHPTYRYLDRAVRLAGLTLSQWTQLVAAGLGVWLLARVLPFSGTYDLSVGLAIAGMPVAASLAAGADAVHPLTQVHAILAWRRAAAVYLPGGGDVPPAGYRLTIAAPPQVPGDLAISSLEDLWD